MLCASWCPQILTTLIQVHFLYDLWLTSLHFKPEPNMIAGIRFLTAVVRRKVRYRLSLSTESVLTKQDLQIRSLLQSESHMISTVLPSNSTHTTVIE